MKKCEACGDDPILYLVKVYNIETGREMWVCLDCLEMSN